MLAFGGRGTLLREVVGRPDDREFIESAFAPRPKPLLEFWGRETERESIARFCGGRTLFRASEPRLPAAGIDRCSPPGLIMFPGRALPARAPELNEPRLPVGDIVRLTTGLAKARCGGTAALPPRDPVMVARDGATPGEWTALIRPKALGETRRLLRETEREFTSVSRETAVNPPGLCMFA
jgi:hypothetical protein